MKKHLSVICALALSATAANAEWRAAPLNPADYPSDVVAETRAPAPNGAPDALIAAGQGAIKAAFYGAPTDRYQHGIMGDAIEHGALIIQWADGASAQVVLPDDLVFEDRYPRLADLDGDGADEIATIIASNRQGAAVAVYELGADGLTAAATTRFIGRPYRWLNIAGIARFLPGADFEDARQIAFVRTPHIGGTLVLATYQNGALREVASQHGFSNHAIGARELRLSAVLDINGDGVSELALPSANRRALKIVGFSIDGIDLIATVALPDRIDKAIAAEQGGFVVGLADGSVWRIQQGTD